MSVQCPPSGLKQTSRRKAATSVFDPGCVENSKSRNATRMTFFSSISKLNALSTPDIGTDQSSEVGASPKPKRFMISLRVARDRGDQE